MLRTLLLSTALVLGVTTAIAQDAATVSVEINTDVSVNYGDNTSEWANDGECDDRRFVGEGMSISSGFLNDDIGHDADDCREQFDLERVTIWLQVLAREATQCDAINFGDNSSEWANDGECDDMRFEGVGSADSVVPDDTSKDAKDCRALCEQSMIFLRDY